MVDIMGTIGGSISTIATADGGERESTQTVDQLAMARQIDGVAFDGSRPISHWGRCDTSGSDTIKAVPCEGYSVMDGARICVLFAYSHLGKDGEFSLNVNNTGAKPIFYAHENATPENFKIIQGDTYEFVFDGTHNIYRVVGDYDTNTTYEVATKDKDGLMSAKDKSALDELTAHPNDGHVLVIQCVDEGRGDELKTSYQKLRSACDENMPVVIYRKVVNDDITYNQYYWIDEVGYSSAQATVRGRSADGETILASITIDGEQEVSI